MILTRQPTFTTNTLIILGCFAVGFLFAYVGLLVLSSALFSLGLCRHQGLASTPKLLRMACHVILALATGVLCVLSAPVIFQFVSWILPLFGCSTLSFVQGYCQMRVNPLWHLMWFSAGLPLGMWVLGAWMRRKHRRSLAGTNDLVANPQIPPAMLDTLKPNRRWFWLRRRTLLFCADLCCPGGVVGGNNTADGNSTTSLVDHAAGGNSTTSLANRAAGGRYTTSLVNHTT